MPRSSARRAQAEPLAALVAAAVVAAALTAAVGAWPAAMPEAGERDRAATALPAALDAMRAGGVVFPERVRSAAATVPDGYRTNVTVAAGNRTWSAGPAGPADADAAGRVVAVRVDGDVRPGRVRVVVWT